MRSNSPDSIADKQNPNLFARSVKGAYWVIGLRVCTHLLDVAKVIILANLLGSAKWGLLALATIVIKSIKIFTETGFKAALIQKKRDTHAYLDTAWTIGLIRGFVLFGILFLVAPYTAELFDGPATFTKSHLFKPAKLAVKLREAKDPLSRYLIENFSPAMRQQLNGYDSSSRPSESLRQGLIHEMNRVVEGDNLYKSELFADIQLSAYTEKLITHADQNHDFTHLNRYRAVGQPKINTKLKVIRLVLLVILIYPLTARWGLVGTAWTIMLVSIIMQPFGWYLVITIVKCGLWETLRPIIFALSSTAVMVSVISLTRGVLFAEITYMSFISLAVIGIAAYLMTAWVCERFFGYTVRTILHEQLAVLSKKNQS